MLREISHDVPAGGYTVLRLDAKMTSSSQVLTSSALATYYVIWRSIEWAESQV